MGFVERVYSYPATFIAEPLESTASTLLKRKAKTLSKLQMDVDRLIEDVRAQYRNNNELADQVSIILIPEKKPLYEKAKSELKTVQHTLDTICPWKKGISWLSTHHKYFVNALDRKVKIRCIIERNADNNLPLTLMDIFNHNNFQNKFVDVLPPTCMGLYDKKRLLIDTSARSLFVETPCLWSDNPSIVGMAQIYFNAVWNT